MKNIITLILMWMSMQANSQSLSLLGHLPYSVSIAGVWHYVDTLGNEYAIVGARDRVSIVDVTNPATPQEVFTVPALPGQNSNWREVKTHGKYAYAVSEGGGGVIIINLSYLPDSIVSKRWFGDGPINGLLEDGHTIAATDGYIYIFGHNLANGGCIIADISYRWNPEWRGGYEEYYVHDGFIRNDTLWTAEIYAGQFTIIDVSDKTNPDPIVTTPTPGQFCHNVWLSDDSQYAFTTDELPNTPVGSFNVSNVNNISLDAEYYTDSLPANEVHNVRVLNNYLINPSYGSQLTIVDASRPHNLIEIAHASTLDTGISYLCWDASPYLPSGNIIATDKNNGLFIFHPDYQRACYLEGNATDSITGNLLNNVFVQIVGTSKNTITGLNGLYATGHKTPGTYNVTFTKAGYYPRTYTNITLSSGVLTTLNAVMIPTSVSIDTPVDIPFNAYITRNNELIIVTDESKITQESNIELIDNSGKLVYKAEFSSKMFLPELTPGIYIVRMDNSGFKPVKVYKEKF